MQTLHPDYLAEIGRQIAFISSFLGGFAATFLATLIVADSPRRVTGWTIASAAFSAAAFIASVIASVGLTIVLHPDAPINVVRSSSILHARFLSPLGFIVGIYTLLLSLGLCGWIRSRKAGIATSLAAGLGALAVTWGLMGFR